VYLENVLSSTNSRGDCLSSGFGRDSLGINLPVSLEGTMKYVHVRICVGLRTCDSRLLKRVVCKAVFTLTWYHV
jgi:hypothetical protein